MVLDQKQNPPSRNSSKIHGFGPQRNARHYKSSLVLNCANNGGLIGGTPPSAASSSSALNQAGPALPRLANALLKSLISTANGPFKSKPAFVDAGDDVIYYSNVAAAPATGNKFSQNDGEEKRGEDGGRAKKGARRSPSLSRHNKSSGEPEEHFSASSSSSHYFSHRQPTTLDQIRQLYKSVPNFSNFDDDEEEEGNGPRGEEGMASRHPISPPSPSARQYSASSQWNGQKPPPPLQTQRKHFSSSSSSTAKRDPSSSSPLSSTTPNSSAASSLASTRSVPTKSGENVKWAPFPAIERVAEQCSEKMVPSSELVVVAKSSDSSLGSMGSECSVASRKKAKEGGGKTMAKKFSPTDSGYRSRGETPKSGGRGRPLSMVICPSENGRGKIGEQPQMGGEPFPRFPAPKRSSVQPEKKLRKYIWSEAMVPEEIVKKWPFTEDEFGEMIRGELGEEKAASAAGGGGGGELATLLHNAFGHLLGQFWRELRRLSGVLVKCTRRDIVTAALLLLPSEIGWDCARYAARACQQLLAANPSEKMTIGERAEVKHFHVGRFLRWMLESRSAAIVDEQTAAFLAAIFDSLLLQFLQLFKSDPRFDHWMAKLAVDGGGLPLLLANGRPFSKSVHILGPPPADGHPSSSLPVFANFLRSLPLAKLVFPGESPTLEMEMFGETDNKMTIGHGAVLALHFWRNCAEWRRGMAAAAEDLEDWLRKAAIFVMHRRANCMEEGDVMQAARLILPNFDCPPPTADHSSIDPTIIGPASKEIILGGKEWAEEEEEHCNGRTVPMPNGGKSLHGFADEFVGWTPLCWAIALEEAKLVDAMLRKKGTCRHEVRNGGLALKICAQTGNLEICQLLLGHGANPFVSPSTHPSSSSPFAFASARGHLPMLQLFLGCCSPLRRSSACQMLHLANLGDAKNAPQPTTNGLNGGKNTAKCVLLTEAEKRAFGEAIWLAAETGRMELVFQLKAIGVPWPNAGIWLECLEWKIEGGGGGEEEEKRGEEEEKEIAQLLETFEPRMGEELMAAEGRRAERFAELLFKLLALSNSNQIRLLAARLLSAQFQQIQRGSLSQLEREFCAYFPGHTVQGQPQIDPKFVDCPDLSDIRFAFSDGQIVFAHRIVLVNASEQFRQILRSPSGVVEVPLSSADSFRLLLEFAYGNAGKCAAQIGKARVEQQIELIELGRRFGLEKMVEIVQKAIGAALGIDRFARIYSFAKTMDLVPLMEDCERFAICNLPELLPIIVGKAEGDGKGEVEGKLMARMKVQFQLTLRESRI